MKYLNPGVSFVGRYIIMTPGSSLQDHSDFPFLLGSVQSLVFFLNGLTHWSHISALPSGPEGRAVLLPDPGALWVCFNLLD